MNTNNAYIDFVVCVYTSYATFIGLSPQIPERIGSAVRKKYFLISSFLFYSAFFRRTYKFFVFFIITLTNEFFI